MARKVFISFLGTGNYVETIYNFPDGSMSNPVRFIQEALILKQCQDWSPNDRIFIFCTAGSRFANWEDGGKETNLEIEKIGLRTRLCENFKLNSIVEMIQIDDGFSEMEVWKIFDIVYDKLEDNDQIYFDVTHAFRSIPLFSSVLFDFSRFMKMTNVVSIQYGAFEKLGQMSKVRQLPLEERVAPVLDLTNIVRLQQYTDMANSALSYGRLRELSELFKSEKNQSLHRIGVCLGNFDEYISTNRLVDIQKGYWLKNIYDNLNSLKKSNMPTPIKKIMERLKGEFSSFVPYDDKKNVEAAILWTSKYNMILQSYTLGQEYLITLLTEKLVNYNFYDNEKSFRIYVSALFSVSENDVKNNQLNGCLADKIELSHELLSKEWIKSVRIKFGKFSDYRNIVNHAKGTQTYSDIQKNFMDNYNNCLTLIKSC